MMCLAHGIVDKDNEMHTPSKSTGTTQKRLPRQIPDFCHLSGISVVLIPKKKIFFMISFKKEIIFCFYEFFLGLLTAKIAVTCKTMK